MALIDSFLEAEPEPGDLLLVQKLNPNRYHKIPLSKIGGQSASKWLLKSSIANSVDSGSRALLDNRVDSWSLNLPASPDIGNEIQLVLLGKKALRLNFSGRPYRGVVDSLNRIIFAAISEETLERLIYVNDVTGWIDINGRIGLFEDYYSLVIALSRFAHYRMSHADPTILPDVTGVNPGVGFGSFELQRPSLLVADTNQSCNLIGISSYVRCNAAAIAGPNAFTIELMLQTSTARGGLVGFSNTATPGGNSFDRELRINNGFIEGMIFPGGVITSTVRVNDSLPHIVTYSVGTFGQRLWLDGSLVATNTNGSASAYSGFWKIGHSASLAAFYQGSIDEVFISHTSAVEADVIRRHRAALGRR